MRKISLPAVPERIGTEFDNGVKEFVEKPFPTELPSYTHQELNALTAKNYNRHIVVCSNGNSGSECLAYCDGFKWVMVPLGVKIPADTDWVAPTLLNSWANHSAVFNPAGYFKDPLGIVRLRGLVKSGNAGTTIFVLPEGCRPPYREMQIVIAYDAVNGYEIGRVDIYAAGNVVLHAGGSDPLPFIQLDGITFRVE